MTVSSCSPGGETVTGNLSKDDILERENYESKYERIRRAIQLRDVLALKSAAAEPGGLLEDSLRKKCWPILLTIDTDSPVEEPSVEEIANHLYYEQVLMDVARSIKRFPPSIPTEDRLNLQDKLIAVIMRVLVANSDLHYYQGYHDICVTVLLVVGGDEDLAFRIMNEVSRTRLRVFMKESMLPTSEQLNMMYSIFEVRDSKLRKFLEAAECSTMFCLSWCLTWFGHDLENYVSLVRLYDLFLANDENNYVLPVYVTAAIVLSESEGIQKQECSLPSVHRYLMEILKGFNEKSSKLEECILHSRKTHAEYPPLRLQEVEQEKIRRDEEYKQWTRTLMARTYFRVLQLSNHVDWKSKGFIGAVMALSFAFGYQMYRRSLTET